MKMAIWHITTHFVVEGDKCVKNTHGEDMQATDRVLPLSRSLVSCEGR